MKDGRTTLGWSVCLGQVLGLFNFCIIFCFQSAALTMVKVEVLRVVIGPPIPPLDIKMRSSPACLRKKHTQWDR
jgi:hypothetical protein